jgi:hypothetical protein
MARPQPVGQEYLQNVDGAPSAQVASGPSGFAIVGASCDGYHCRPLALTSADGRAWVPGDVRRHASLRRPTAARPSTGSAGTRVLRAAPTRLLRGTPDVAYEGAALMDVIESGGWLAVGWAQAGNTDAEPAVWRSSDAGATWEPIPPEGIPPGGDRADHMERVIAWSGYLLATGIEQNGAGGIEPRLWLSAGANEWRSTPPDTGFWYVRDVTSLVSGEAFLGGSNPSLEGAVWRAKTEGAWERVQDPELAPLASVYGLKAGESGLVLLGTERGSDPQSSAGSRPGLWGSPDGVHWLQTLRLEERGADWSAVIPTSDRWFVYGTTGEGPDRRQVVWTTIPRCATGGSICPAG